MYHLLAGDPNKRKNSFLVRSSVLSMQNLELSGASLDITDKMEAWLPNPLLVPQAQTRDEGVSSCDSDLFLPFFG